MYFISNYIDINIRPLLIGIEQERKLENFSHFTNFSKFVLNSRLLVFLLWLSSFV